MTKQDKHFTAILAKNDIAREIADFRLNKGTINFNLIVACLTQIEDYIGTSNQPAASEIFINNSNSNKQFNI